METKSKVEIAYKMILNKISNGEYVSGDRVVISNIAKECNISTIPVREAIRLLEKDGFLRTQTNRGAIVNSIEKETLLGQYQIKSVLEAYATRLAVDYLTPEDYAHLREMNEELKLIVERNDTKAFSELNVEFHMYIYRAQPYSDLTSMIDTLWKNWLLIKSVFVQKYQLYLYSCYEHEILLQFMEKKDYDKVESLAREHKFRAQYSISNDQTFMLRENGDGPNKSRRNSKRSIT